MKTSDESAALSERLKREYLFNMTDTKLLLEIYNDQVNVKQLVENELKSRGLNGKGDYIGLGN
jgi:hypothetical protein